MNTPRHAWPFTALVVVDASPRWIYDHTALLAAPDHEQLAMARLTERLSTLMQTIEEARLPTIVVESHELRRVRLADLRGPAHRLGLAGVYGDYCVLEVAERLQRRGYHVVILEDACLWSQPLAELLHDEPRLHRLRRVRVLPACPALADMNPAWQGEIPHF